MAGARDLPPSTPHSEVRIQPLGKPNGQLGVCPGATVAATLCVGQFREFPGFSQRRTVGAGGGQAQKLMGIPPEGCGGLGHVEPAIGAEGQGVACVGEGEGCSALSSTNDK